MTLAPGRTASVTLVVADADTALEKIKIILDAMQGDATLFARNDEVEEAVAETAVAVLQPGDRAVRWCSRPEDSAASRWST